MKHLWTTARLDMRLQARNKLYVIGVVVALLTGLGARYFLAVTTVAMLLPGVWLSAIGSTTFMFVAGMILLEKGERTLDALIVTPLPVPTYLSAKVVTLSAFAVLESLIVLVLAHGMGGVSMLPLLLGLSLLGTLYTLSAIALAVTQTTVTDFLVPGGVVVLTALQLPFLHAFELWHHPLLYLLPTQATVVLMKGGFVTLEPWQWAYGVGYALLWAAMLAWLARARFVRHIVQRGALV